MKSQTSLVASNVRLHEWAQQIQECNNRPAGMQVKDWCALNGITKANYYYRLRRVRQACLNVLSEESDTTVPQFVELKAPDPAPVSDHSVAARVLTPSGISLELFNTASSEAIHNILKACAYVK